jgi:hypothetical protein
MRLLGRKKPDKKQNPADVDPSTDEGIIGLFYSILGEVEDDFGNAARRHLARIHEPGGYDREKAEHDFMDLGMRRSYIEALDDIEFSVQDSVVMPFLPARRRGMAHVVSRWEVRGIHNRPLLSIEPSGQQVTIAGLTFTTFRNYNVRVDYSYWEMPALTGRMVGR